MHGLVEFHDAFNVLAALVHVGRLDGTVEQVGQDVELESLWIHVLVDVTALFDGSRPGGRQQEQRGPLAVGRLRRTVAADGGLANFFGNLGDGTSVELDGHVMYSIPSPTASPRVKTRADKFVRP